MEQKVIEIARGVAKTSTFATKNEALRFAKSEGGAAIGIYENGGMYMFAFGAYKPQMVYSKLVYELKKSYNTGVHRTYTTDDGVFVSYMPLRKKMRRHGHGSPVPPPSVDIVFVGDENAALSGMESDLVWTEEDEVLTTAVFVKSTAYDKIAEAAMEIDGTQIGVNELAVMSIAEAKGISPSLIVPQGFGDSDYFVSYAAGNVSDITEGDKAKVVLIDSDGEEFAQTNEKKIHIIPVQEEPDYLSFTGEAENAKLLMSFYSEEENPEMPNIQYSTDKTNWHQVAFSEGEEFVYLSPEFSLGIDETIYFKGENPDGLSISDSEIEELVREFSFVIDGGAVSAGGDVGTLTDGVGGAGVSLTGHCYQYVFTGCTSLTAAPALPATTLADSCYAYMFNGCTSLTSAPALPATTLADYCYVSMFSGCTSLTSAPALPATTLADYCYIYMFSECTFDMSDNGTTFNFDFGATLPQTVMSEDPETGDPMELTMETHKDVALWMGNTNGFN